MKAAYYTKQGNAREVLQIGNIEEILPKEDEVQIKIEYSAVNPGEVKKRSDAFGVGMPYDLIVPHSDGAGVVSKIGEGVDESWIGKKVLCFGAQSYRQYGTAAEFCCVPVQNAIEIGHRVDIRQAAQMGIPGITAHRSINVGSNSVRVDRQEQVILVQGGSGAVGQCAIAMAVKAGARVIATVRKKEEIEVAKTAGASSVYLADGTLKEKILADTPEGIDHIVEVAFAANIETDVAILKQGGSIATYATNDDPANIPFWQLVFSNISVYFLGSDDLSQEVKIAAINDLTEALSEGWSGLDIGQEYTLESIAEAHLHVEERKGGRAIIKMG
ncbi:MAG: NADPH:quinone reductase [Flavobacteriales bacterium]|nr:NADPH:quinone reductase [Flavobacteriales bacterium]